MMSESSDSKKLSDEWHDFTENVSMHGVKYVNEPKISLLRRIVWLILILVWLSYFCYAGFLFMDDYTKRAVLTKIRVETAKELKFPTVTVCNKNFWMLDAVTYIAIKRQSDAVFDALGDLYDTQRPSPPPADKYNWSSPAHKPIANITPQEGEVFLKASAHPLQYSILDCQISGNAVNCADAFQVVATDSGYCFQLNSNGSMTATAAGKTGGIFFKLNAMVDQYTTGPSSNSEGFMLTLHDSHEVPLVADLGMGLAPGVEADIALHKSETVRKPPPADGGKANCFDTMKLPNPLHYYKNYSYSACQVECRTSYVINNCGCKDALQPALNDTEICYFPDLIYCSTPALRSFAADPKGLKSCDCKDACKVSEYSAKITTTKFPSNRYATVNGYDATTLDSISKNMLLVNIYYGKMSYQRLDEEFAYGITDMIANLGGTLGLCVGASVLTLCEFMEFGVRALIKCLIRQRKSSHVNALRIKVTPVEQFP